MSHQHERKEKKCLNCGADLYDRFCHKCGQENVEPKQTLWHLIMHFFKDITHFDGKFFVTMKALLLKPGFLTTEYVKGRRMKYLDPVRMYLFVSFVFFLLYLTVSSNKTEEAGFNYEDDYVAMHTIDTGIAGLKARNQYTFGSKVIDKKTIVWINFNDKYTHGYKHYDSVQKTVPNADKHSWIRAYYDRKLVDVARAYEKDPYTFLDKLIDNIFHSLSKIFFFSLPVFSFLITLLYIRRRKDFYYVSHAIFSIHCYTVAWFFFAINSIIEAGLKLFKLEAAFISVVIYLGLLAYFYIAMLRFYKQGWFKTFVKYFILLVIMSIVLFLILFGIILNSFFIIGAH